jgi:hypothetical protein
MRVRPAFAGLVMACAAVACAQVSAPPPAESPPPVLPPPPKYSAAEIAAMFEHPDTVTGLLQNLKIAVDRDLVQEPGFDTDANLLKFFDGTQVRREVVTGWWGARVDQEDAFVTVDDARFPRMSVEVRKGLNRLTVDHEKTPVYLRRFGSMRVNLEEVPGVTVSAVRAVFGKETLALIGGDWASDGHQAPETQKGSLFYGDPADADVMVASLTRKTVRFIIKLTDAYRMTPPWRRDKTLQDTDTVDRIFIYDPAP